MNVWVLSSDCWCLDTEKLSRKAEFFQYFIRFLSYLRWLDTVFNTLTCSNYAFLGFIQQILGFLYILISLLSNYISFSKRSFVAMTTYVYEIHSKMAYRLVLFERSMVTPNFFSCIILLGRKANNLQNIKNSVMPFFWKMRKCHILR
jgi:hypothetical protein